MRESLQLNQSGDRASTGRFAKSCFPNAWNTFRQCYLSVTTQSNKRLLLTLRNPSNVLSNISFFFANLGTRFTVHISRSLISRKNTI